MEFSAVLYWTMDVDDVLHQEEKRVFFWVFSMAVTALAPGLSRKLKKVLETRTDSPDLLSSLGTLSTFYSDNTPQARRNLKSSIEQRALAINHQFLDASFAAQQVSLSFTLSIYILFIEIYENAIF